MFEFKLFIMHNYYYWCLLILYWFFNYRFNMESIGNYFSAIANIRNFSTNEGKTNLGSVAAIASCILTGGFLPLVLALFYGAGLLSGGHRVVPLETVLNKASPLLANSPGTCGPNQAKALENIKQAKAEIQKLREPNSSNLLKNPGELLEGDRLVGFVYDLEKKLKVDTSFIREKPVEDRVVALYARSMYAPVNDHMRNDGKLTVTYHEKFGGIGKKEDYFGNRARQQYIANLHKHILDNNAREIEREMAEGRDRGPRTLHRVHHFSNRDLGFRSDIGKLFANKSFLSTSSKPGAFNAVEAFQNQLKNKDNRMTFDDTTRIQMEITLLPSTPFYDVDGKGVGLPGENEILLPPGRVFEVVSYDKSKQLIALQEVALESIKSAQISYGL